MIFDKLSNASLYYGNNDRLYRALKWLQATDFNTLQDGRITIDGNEIYANISTGSTKPEMQTKIELHTKYIDIQYVITGEEYIGILPKERLGTEISRDEEKDHYGFEGKSDLILVPQGFFMVLYPQEGHAPRIMKEKQASTRKAIVKVLV
jgi:YhcH/YjgK/YiaL family protein